MNAAGTFQRGQVVWIIEERDEIVAQHRDDREGEATRRDQRLCRDGGDLETMRLHRSRRSKGLVHSGGNHLARRSIAPLVELMSVARRQVGMPSAPHPTLLRQNSVFEPVLRCSGTSLRTTASHLSVTGRTPIVCAPKAPTEHVRRETDGTRRNPADSLLASLLFCRAPSFAHKRPSWRSAPGNEQIPGHGRWRLAPHVSLSPTTPSCSRTGADRLKIFRFGAIACLPRNAPSP